MKALFLLTISLLAVWAQDEIPVAERITHISESLLEGYTQPLITAFGTAISTGLFHSAYSHDVFGFDLGVRVLYIRVPPSARYFTGNALVCSLSTQGFVCDTIELDSISTVFGPEEETTVPASGNAIGIPQSIPGGFNMSGVPLVLPQLNLGLVGGAELAFRYVPFTFKGSKVRFWGFGIKQELTRLPGLDALPLPGALAVGGAYQVFSIWDSLGSQIVNSRTWNLQVIFSKRIAAFEPFAGAGLEGTRVYIPYKFEYEIPDTITPDPTQRITVTDTLNVVLYSQNHYRAMVGFTLNLGLLYLHYDYNITPYATHDVHIGLSFR